jgi:serine/threonine-protein kinase
MRALALDPHERYPSAEVFRSDLVDVRPLLPGGSFAPPPSVARPQPPSRFNPVVATIVALALVGIGLLLYFLLRNDSVRIPAVTGQTAAAAQRTLADAGLRSSLVHEKSTDVAVGRAIRTDPAAGSEVAKDSAVLVVINGNQADIRVPSLIGQTKAAAADNLSQLGLRATFSQTRDAAPAGTVVGQSPPPAASVAPGTIVTLTVSSGAPTQTVERTTTVQTTSTVTTPAPAPATVRVPTATGMTLDEASRAITAAGLAIGTITNERTQSQPPGTVIRQDPPAGSRVGTGAQVALVVAAG